MSQLSKLLAGRVLSRLDDIERSLSVGSSSGLTWRGDYDADVDYETNDAVRIGDHAFLVTANTDAPLVPSTEAGAASTRIAAQASAIGQTVGSLTVVDDRIYAAYGDFGVNDGPIYPVYLDGDLAWQEDDFAMQTEESSPPVLLVDGRLVVAHRDPLGVQLDAYSERDTEGEWSSKEFGLPDRPVHVFAMLEAADRLWACGARDSGAGIATVWMSEDGGDTWEVSLSGDTDDGRFYVLAAIGETVYTQDATEDGDLYKWTDGAGWTTADTDARLTRPGDWSGRAIPWRDGVVVVGDRSSTLRYFDGERSYELSGGAGTATAGDDGTLYAVSLESYGFGLVNGRVLTYDPTGPSLSPQVHPATFTMAPGEVATAVAIADDGLVIGTTSSRIFTVAFAPTTQIERAATEGDFRTLEDSVNQGFQGLGQLAYEDRDPVLDEVEFHGSGFGEDPDAKATVRFGESTYGLTIEGTEANDQSDLFVVYPGDPTMYARLQGRNSGGRLILRSGAFTAVLQVASGASRLISAQQFQAPAGLIIASPDGSLHRLLVADDGTVSTEPVA